MIERTITALLLVVAVIHLLPMVGVLGSDRLAALYQVQIDDPNLEILMRHRAVLFGVLGAFFAYAAFRPAFQPAAFLLAAVSVVSFFGLCFSVGGFNSALLKVVLADVVAAISLGVAFVLYLVAATPR